MTTLIKNATIVNEGTEQVASLLIEGDHIKAILSNEEAQQCKTDELVDATGMYLLPGVIDDHVHMRDPGLTHKADMDTETQAAAAGGVTSVMDMPNVVPQTTTLALWQDKMDYAAHTCHTNYAFYIGATNTNIEEVRHIDPTRIPALKLFMGSSTGGMLVDKEELLRGIFEECPTLIMTHCEDTARINERMAAAKAEHGDDPDVSLHAWIRDDEACYQSSALAVRLAKETGARLHLAHITTEKELSLLNKGDDVTKKQITAEVCPQHLVFTQDDHAELGALIKCNPAIKKTSDREALRQAVRNGLIDVIGTDHAPHLLSEKQGGAQKAVSGMPMMQFSLPLMLTLCDDGHLSRTKMVELMCHNPALLFGIKERGYIRQGYKADLALVKKEEWTVTESDILSKCGWSPLTGKKLAWRVVGTWCNGHRIFDGKQVDTTYHGEALCFTH